MIGTNSIFPCYYRCEYLREIPGSTSLARYYYPGGSSEGGRDGVLVEVHPAKGDSWLGLFAFGDISPKSISGLFTTPDADRLCVVAQGRGYFVTAMAPSSWEYVDANPILNVFPILAKEIIVFAEFNRLFAYGRSGRKWVTTRIAWDGMNITEVTDEFIGGDFWDVASQTTVRFKVNLDTGHYEIV